MLCSLIIPAYNAEKTIITCLESACSQSLSRDSYEIIVVDDGSGDKTPEIAARYPVKLIRQKNQGPATARNRGAKEARGKVLVFTDSDCELDPEFLKNIIAPIRDNPEIVGVQGSYKTKQLEFMAQFGQVEIETRYQKMAQKKQIDFIGTYAAAYRRDIFHQYGGFDTGFPLASGEDTEFSYKLFENGHKMVFKPDAFVYHQHPSKLKKYLKSKFYRGFWRIRLYRKHPAKTVNDSYTPQSLKLQVLGIPFFIIFIPLSGFSGLWLFPVLLIAISFLYFSIPFFKLFNEKGYKNKLFTPFILFFRASAILFGLLFGTLNTFIKPE